MEKVLTECCWSHVAQAQSPVTGTPCVLIFFLSFLTKIKQDQALPSHVAGKILPHSTQFWFGSFSFVILFWDTLKMGTKRSNADERTRNVGLLQICGYMELG